LRTGFSSVGVPDCHRERVTVLIPPILATPLRSLAALTFVLMTMSVTAFADPPGPLQASQFVNPSSEQPTLPGPATSSLSPRIQTLRIRPLVPDEARDAPKPVKTIPITTVPTMTDPKPVSGVLPGNADPHAIRTLSIRGDSSSPNSIEGDKK
jgi:hypothetical protein